MLRSLLLAVLVCPGPAFAQAEAEPTPEPEAKAAGPIREVVEAGNTLFQRAFEERDAERIADLYTEDGRLLPPGAEPVTGREAIAAFWAGQMKESARVRLETRTVEAEGNLAVEEGVVRLSGHDGSESAAQYVVVWKRVGRRWHLHRDIWNAAAPAASAPTPALDSAPEPGPTPSDAETALDPAGAPPPDPAGAPPPEAEVTP